MSHDVILAGRSPTPIASYLEALAMLRLVGEQVDCDARGFWSAEAFILRSDLDADGLRRFLLDDYRPSPILGPWNAGQFVPDSDDSLAERTASEDEHCESRARW